MLKCTFDWGRLLLTLHNQLLENLHQSCEAVVYRVVAEVIPAGNIGLKLRFFQEFFHDIRCFRNFGFGIRCFE